MFGRKTALMKKYKNIVQNKRICYNAYRWMIYIASPCEKKLCNYSTTAPFKITTDSVMNWFFCV
ncbi:unknown [Clostridium sp. CAG:451]|nr:unknown [Clostridium sp. CAG:451]